MRTGAAAVLLVLLGTAPADAALVDLTAAQIAEAIAVGKSTFEEYRKIGRPIDDLDPQYVINAGDDVGRVLVYTEFSTIVLETRRYLAIARPFSQAQADEVLMQRRGRIECLVVVVGMSRDFLQGYKVALIDPRGEHEPIGWDISRSTPKPGAPDTYLASAHYIFAARDLAVDAPATLVLRSPEGREVRFPIDFSRLR